MSTTLTGQVERVTYENEETSFRVIRVGSITGRRKHISSNVSPPNFSHGVAPISAKLGASWARPSTVLPGRGCSSRSRA